MREKVAHFLEISLQRAQRTCTFHILISVLRSPLKDIVVGKNQSEWKKFRVGGKNIFQMFCVLSQNFCVPSRNFAFSPKLLRSLAKIFAFPRKNCEGTQISLRENAKVLRENAKFLEGTQKFCERTQSFSRERKSFARERKTFEKYFFLPPWIFFHSPRIFPTTMSLKGLRSVFHSTCWKTICDQGENNQKREEVL